MRFAGIDVAAERHVAAVVDESGKVLCKPSSFGEDAAGYAQLFQLLGACEDCFVTLEATGHYWKNLFVSLVTKGYAVAVLNPLRTRRFAEEELERTKTDAIDALGIARFGAQKRPAPTPLPESASAWRSGRSAQAVTSSGRPGLSRVYKAHSLAGESACNCDLVTLSDGTRLSRLVAQEARQVAL